MSDDPLAAAREAYGRQAWADAYRGLCAADESGRLGAEDLDRLGVAAQLTGHVETAGVAWARAHRAWYDDGDPGRAVRCAFWLGLTLMERGEHARGGGWFARARRVLDECPPDRAEQGYLCLPHSLRALAGGDPDAAYAGFEQAAALGASSGDADLSALGRLGCGQALVARGDPGGGVAMLDEAMLAVATGEVSPLATGTIYCAVIITCHRMFDVGRAQEWTTVLDQWCAAQPDLRPYRGQCMVHRSELLQLRGHWTEALAEIERARAHLADLPGDPAQGMALYRQADLLRVRGDYDRAELCYREAGTWGHPVHPGLALLRLAQGRVDDAIGAARRVAEEVRDPSDRAPLLAAYAEIALVAGEPGEARSAVAELRRTAARFDSPYLRAVVDQAHGGILLAEGDAVAAARVLDEAKAAWRSLDAPYEAARTGLLLADACARLHDHDTARMEREAARAILRRLGAAPEAGRTGERWPSSAGGDGLTGRELQVLRRVAAGRTNRQIAGDLAISEHTVRRHLQNIYAKLGLGSRSGATAYAYEHGLV
ncbi:LuxR family transcriptional regulator [Nocardiopsis aegyptia]|uniref:DNA-binding CsgD family transcriptional regulator n=1 Tax=Nocardiopsis aegyptia TaxID=220378 RepID=A0A7Z0ERD4_9ACTN|nr:LuxR family transcriptional regulator [Nocardiopsis aegyptia]NYJ36892.1 DNA-binding CsgD family transcriptional regulator [Nocardiopsis aegyptia]